jgi:hypothetical protein
MEGKPYLEGIRDALDGIESARIALVTAKQRLAKAGDP